MKEDGFVVGANMHDIVCKANPQTVFENATRQRLYQPCAEFDQSDLGFDVYLMSISSM